MAVDNNYFPAQSAASGVRSFRYAPLRRQSTLPTLMMRSFARLSGLLAGILAVAPLAHAGAQDTASVRPAAGFTEGVVTVSGDSVDRLRIAELEGTAKPEGLMLRSTSTLTDALRSGGVRRRFTIVFPQLTFVNNSELPFGTNDGAL